MRKFLLLISVLSVSCLLKGQSLFPDSLYGNKKTYTYVSIQANLLLQQFISFNSNSSINTNPYIFSYSKNNAQTGRGSVFGTGFNISENSTNDGVSSVRVQNINATFRFGAEKKFMQQERFIPLIGVEIAMGGLYNKTESRLNQSFNTSNTTVVETTKFFVGPSFRGGLLVALSKHILLGTEFFFNAQISYSQTDNGANNGSSSSVVPFNMGFQAPTALYLVFKY